MSFPVPQRVQDYVDLLDDKRPFTHANVGGDGEFLTIVGWGGVNSDGKKSTPEKSKALARTILEPRLTLHGYNPGRADSSKRGDAEAWLHEHGVNVPELDHSVLRDPDFGGSRVNVRWVHKEIISSANARGHLAPFVQALRRRRLYVIASGGVSYDFVRGQLGGHLFWVPPSVGWGQLDDLYGDVRKLVLSAGPAPVFTWSLGYLTKVLVWRLADARPDATHIDMGACWDPYCGTLNRHGYRLPSWPGNMERNLAT